MAATNTPPNAAPAWRQFSFFDAAPVRDVHDLGASPEVFKTPAEISTLGTTSVGVLVADIHGSIHVLDREFVATRSWVAHAGGRVTHLAEKRGILVTLGEEEATRLPLLKIWDLEHNDKKTGLPLLLRSVKVQHGSRPHPVSTIALSHSLSHLAIGLADGAVLLYRHLDQSLFAGSNSLTSLPKPKIILDSATEPITGLGFREPDEEKLDKDKDKDLHLFIVTTNRVLVYLASGKGSGGTPAVIDEVGAGLGCAVMDQRAREMVVGRDDAIYMCGPEGRGACFAIEWPKVSIKAYGVYLIIVSPPFFPSFASNSATVRNAIARAPNPTAATQVDVGKVTIFDIENKFIAYSETFKEGVRDVVCAWGEIFVLCNDGSLSRLEEKPTTEKLDMFFRKSLYLLAVNLARSQGVEEAGIAEIYRRYGDHLYAKGDYDGAMQQFVKTLGHLQPSYVIRKFLDAQRIHNLTTYLQVLHAQGFANADHTTLLLNTYTKLKDVARLDSFIKDESHQDRDELPFDLDTAIRVCRQAGYFEHAVYLAKKYQRHEDYLRIQLDDTGNYKDALTYLREMGPEAAEKNLAKYGRAMLQSLPDETTQLLIDLCSGSLLLDKSEPDESNGSGGQVAVRPASALPSYLAYLPYSRLGLNGGGAGDLVPPSPLPNNNSNNANAGANASAGANNAESGRPSPHRRSSTHHEGSGAGARNSNATDPPPTPPLIESLSVSKLHKPPSPRQYFAHFLDHPKLFVEFLERVAWNRWGQRVEGGGAGAEGGGAVPRHPLVDEYTDKRDQAATWNTLLELYLLLSSSEGDAALTAVMHEKALQLLKQPDTLPYDPTHALIVCSTRSFTEGLVLLWENMGMYEDVLRFWMDKESEGASDSASDNANANADSPSQRVLHFLTLYGPHHPHLYPLVLRFFTSTPALLTRHTTDVEEILAHIDKEGIMPPLGVIQLLSRNGVASVGLVKEWLMRHIAESKSNIDADRQLIDAYRTETKAKLEEIAELTDPDRPRVFHVTRCSACGGQLDLPSVHFMCKHSYHQRCLADHETDCPNCAQSHGLTREIILENERFAHEPDLFLADVEGAGFSAIASAFSRTGLFTTTV